MLFVWGHIVHTIIKQCAFVHVKPREYNHEMPHLMRIHIEYTLATASHGYILKAHVNERTHIVENVMSTKKKYKL